MRKEDFDTEISQTWGAHRTKLRQIFQGARALSDPVHMRMEQLHHTIAQATGEETKILWGPARYDLVKEEISVPYQIICEKAGRSFRTTITYGPTGAQFNNLRFDAERLEGLLQALTQRVCEAFRPPDHREMEIYPVRS